MSGIPKLSIGLSFSILRQAQRWDPGAVKAFRRLVSHPTSRSSGSGLSLFLFWLDIGHFIRRMQWMREELERLFGKRPVVTDTTEMITSPEIYCALQSAGFRGVLTEGRKQLLDWRSPGFVYVAPGGRLRILARHNTLSVDVGYRFSNRGGTGIRCPPPTMSAS
jgi:alpha-amylase